MKPSLLILAAGIGSRYGGLKQLEGLGPSGETIMEYSIYDALGAGFGKVVFIIRKEFQNQFEERFARLKKQIEVAYAFQEISPKFAGIENIAQREKPWGTVHALLSATELVHEPFAVINADDFYGKEAFVLMSEFLKTACMENCWSMVGYALKNTLSAYGGVSRGICEMNENGLLKNVKECRGIQKDNDEIFYKEGESKILLKGNVIVSMNCWGFHRHFFKLAEGHFKKFVLKNASNSKAEVVIPDLVQPLLTQREVNVSILVTNDKWFGVTHKEDKKSIIRELNKLVKSGIYPQRLWE